LEEIKIELRPPVGTGVLAKGCLFPSITIDGNDLSADEKDSLAFADGFETFAEMMQFWEGRLPFVGDIIHWKFLGEKK